MSNSNSRSRVERIAIVETQFETLQKTVDNIEDRLLSLERKVWLAAGFIAAFEIALKFLFK